MANATKDNFFKPTLSRTESKSQTTDKIARQIIDDEAAQRERKSERLRAARLAREADDRGSGSIATPKKKKGAKAAKPGKK